MNEEQKNEHFLNTYAVLYNICVDFSVEATKSLLDGLDSCEYEEAIFSKGTYLWLRQTKDMIAIKVRELVFFLGLFEKEIEGARLLVADKILEEFDLECECVIQMAKNALNACDTELKRVFKYWTNTAFDEFKNKKQ